MSQPIRGQGGHFVFPIGPKNTNLVEGVDILLPIKFHWIQLSGFRGKVKNVSANQRPGRISCFSNQPKNTHLRRAFSSWFLSSFLEFHQRFQRRSRKYLSQSEARRPSCFSDRPEKHKHGRGRWDLASCEDSLNSVQRFLQRSQKCPGQSEAGAAILFFRSAETTQTW